MASLQLTIKKVSAPLRSIADSAMGRHVTQLGLVGSRVPLTADSLFIVARLMPQLCELTCDLQLTPTPGPLTFPPALLKLNLQVTGDPAAADVNAALQAVGRLRLLESFTVWLPSINDQLSFASLASLPQLRDLAIQAPNRASLLSDTQVAELRAMPQLQRLDVWPMPTSLLRRLLAQPHQLQWQEIITLPRPTDDEAAALLPQLPSLTKIDVCCLATQFGWLRQLPNLTRVGIAVCPTLDEGRVEVSVAGLQRCTQIEHLSLCCSGLLGPQLAGLLPRLPRLRTLDLFQLEIDSLSFLALQPMTQQLSSLSIAWCRELPVAELRHVHALKGLQSLTIRGSFVTPLDDHSRWLLTPPSVALPQLEDFEYSAP